MKKLIAILLAVTSMLSFFILFNNEKREQQSNMERAEQTLQYNIKIIIPTKVDIYPKEKTIKGIEDTLNKYDASIYYKRLTKGDETQSTYIYVNDNEYLSKFSVRNGRMLQKEDMNENKFISTKNKNSSEQVGTLSSFCKENEFEIYTLGNMLEKDYSFGGECYISFNEKTDTDIFIKDLEKEINVPGIQIVDNQSIDIPTNSNMWIILLIYFVVLLLILYDLLKSYKKIGVEKLLGNSDLRIYTKRILELIKLYIVIFLISNIAMAIIKFHDLNSYVITFLSKLLRMNLMLGLIFVVMSSIPLIYINKISIINMLKNKRLTTEILVFNFFIKIIMVTLLTFIVNQGVSNFDRIKNVFSDSFKQWEDVKDYAIIPQLINITPDVVDTDEFTQNQKELYDYFNDKGAILANFGEYSPGIREIRKSETSSDYERNNVTVNPNYLDKYPIYDLNGDQISISEEDENYIVLIPEIYKQDEQEILKLFDRWKQAKFGAKSENQPNKIIWIKSNQKLFSMQIDINPNENNYVDDAIVHVMTKKNASLVNYNIILGIADSPFKIKVDDYKNPNETIMPILKQYNYDKYVENILCISEQTASESKSIKDMITFLSISILLTVCSLILVIVQNIHNFFDKYKKIIAIKKLNGYTMYDKYKQYFVMSILSWIIIFSITIIKLPIKTVLGTIVVGIVTEFLLSIIVLFIVDRKKVISVIKEGL